MERQEINLPFLIVYNAMPCDHDVRRETQVLGLIADVLSTDPETSKSDALAIAEEIEECLVSLLLCAPNPSCSFHPP